MRKILLAAFVIWFSTSGLLAGHTWFSVFSGSHFKRGFSRHHISSFRPFRGGFLHSGYRGFRSGFHHGYRYPGYYRGSYGYGYGPYYRPPVRTYSYSGPPSSYYYASSDRYRSYAGYGSAVYQLQKPPSWASYGSGNGEVVQANYGDLVFRVEPNHALVYLNGKLIGSARSFASDRDRYTLLDGEYKIRIVLPGYEPFEADLQVVPNRTHYIDVELKPLP